MMSAKIKSKTSAASRGFLTIAKFLVVLAHRDRLEIHVVKKTLYSHLAALVVSVLTLIVKQPLGLPSLTLYCAQQTSLLACRL